MYQGKTSSAQGGGGSLLWSITVYLDLFFKGLYDMVSMDEGNYFLKDNVRGLYEGTLGSVYSSMTEMADIALVSYADVSSDVSEVEDFRDIRCLIP